MPFAHSVMATFLRYPAAAFPSIVWTYDYSYRTPQPHSPHKPYSSHRPGSS